jgi:cyclic pyranopterin phosphate synthase
LGSVDTMTRIRERTVPKGDVLEMAKTAGLFGVKQTANMIPDCHPMPIEFTSVDYELGVDELLIKVTCSTIYKTGVEVEAMHGASVVALTMYDMLKPIDKNIEISAIKLLSKTGGKSDIKKRDISSFQAHIISCSNAVSRGDKEASSAAFASEFLQERGLATGNTVVVPESTSDLEKAVSDAVSSEVELLLVFGSTGLSKKDIAQSTLAAMYEKSADGIAQAIAQYGLERNRHAMLSNCSAGYIGKTLLISLPGSSNGTQDAMHALFPFAFHLLGRY